MTNQFKMRTYRDSDKNSVIEVWHKCGLIYPQNNPENDIQLKMEFQPDLFIVGETGGELIAAMMIGYDGHRGWINYLGVLPLYQKKGYGKEMVLFGLEKLKQLGCPKVNLQVRESNLSVIKFYEDIGFKRDQVVSFGYRFSK